MSNNYQWSDSKVAKTELSDIVLSWICKCWRIANISTLVSHASFLRLNIFLRPQHSLHCFTKFLKLFLGRLYCKHYSQSTAQSTAHFKKKHQTSKDPSSVCCTKVSYRQCGDRSSSNWVAHHCSSSSAACKRFSSVSNPGRALMVRFWSIKSCSSLILGALKAKQSAMDSQ